MTDFEWMTTFSIQPFDLVAGMKWFNCCLSRLKDPDRSGLKPNETWLGDVELQFCTVILLAGIYTQKVQKA